jgi:hypothetical protein
LLPLLMCGFAMRLETRTTGSHPIAKVFYSKRLEKQSSLAVCRSNEQLNSASRTFEDK